MTKTLFAFLNGVAVACLLSGEPICFLVISLFLALFRFPYIMLFFAILYDVAFWNYPEQIWPFYSLAIMFVYAVSSFVRRRFLW